jgi:hypothetical protein
MFQLKEAFGSIQALPGLRDTSPAPYWGRKSTLLSPPVLMAFVTTSQILPAMMLNLGIP